MTDIDDETARTWWAWEWTQGDLGDDMDEALAEACGGDKDEAEAFAAYLCEFPDVLNDRHGLGPRVYTAEDVRAIAAEAQARTYDYWDEIAIEWIEDHGGGETMAMLHHAADAAEDDVLNQIIVTLGRQLADSDGAYWFFHTGLLSDGLVYCFKRPS